MFSEVGILECVGKWGLDPSAADTEMNLLSANPLWIGCEKG